jgi:hypothetical protein
MVFMVRSVGSILAAGLLATACALAGCGGGGNSTPTPVPISVTMGQSMVTAPQDGSPVIVPINITSTSETATLSFLGLPAGVSEQYSATDTNPSGTIKFIASTSAPAGAYTPTVTVNSAGQTASASFTLVVAPVVKVSNVVDTTLGVNGRLEQFMSTSFQISQWTADFFGTDRAARESTLNALGPQHIRMQVIGGAVPMLANAGLAADWDFTILDRTLQPILESADHSPEFQIATAPAWMCDSNGHLLVGSHMKDFAAFSANLVRYYNKGGFDWGGKHFQSPGSHPIIWWGIFNEYNLNGLTAAEYVQLYNTVVPAMLAVDPTIKISALELSEFGLGTGDAGDPMLALPVFLAAANAGGVNTQVDVLSTHFYSTCNQRDTDADLLGSIPEFVASVNYFYKELKTRPDLAKAAVWVTENNVNADYLGANGMSTCNPGQVFVNDDRGTSAFFAAWRPFVFSQLGKTGNQAIFQWVYSDNKQYGEADPSGNPYLSYWVDKTLASTYPSTPASPGPEILALSATDNASIETLATRDNNGAVTVMVVDRAVRSSADNNGAGEPRTVVVDTTSLGTYGAANVLTIDAATNLVNGPTSAGVTPSGRMSITLNGYGFALITLLP